MKYQIVWRADLAEIHAESCRDIDREDGFWADRLVDADHQFGAAWQAWEGHDHREQRVLQGTLFCGCLNGAASVGRGRVKRRTVPFELDDLDAAVIGACYGRTLTWVNSISGDQQTAKMFPEGPRRHMVRGTEVFTEPHRHTTITVSATGIRSLNFIDAAGYGFRSVRLDSIVSVK